jgi:hypothetical protein
VFAKSHFPQAHFPPCYWPPGFARYRRRGYIHTTTSVYHDQTVSKPRFVTVMEAVEYARRIMALDRDEEEAIILIATAVLEIQDD